MCLSDVTLIDGKTEHEEEDMLAYIKEKFEANEKCSDDKVIDCHKSIKRIVDEDNEDQVNAAFDLIEEYEKSSKK